MDLPLALEAFRAALGDDAVDTHPKRCLRASRDYYWMSPILSAELDGRPPAEAVIKPKTIEEAQEAMRIAYRYGIPVTPRGKGTGNYGQAVPYDGGVVFDLTALNRILEVEDGWMTAESGAIFTEMEAAAAESGQELQIVPSTTKSTFGGFLSGGAGGAGSVQYGFLWNDFVDWLDILPCTEEAEIFRVHGKETFDYLHAFGSTGIIVRGHAHLRTKRDWTALYFSFDADKLADAAKTMKAFVRLPILPRLNSLDLPAAVELLPENSAMPKGRISVRPMVDQSMVAECIKIAEANGGSFEAERPDDLELLHLMSYNHVTLRAKQKRSDFCHLQVGGEQLIEQTDDILGLLPESTLHMECRLIGESHSFGGLFLSRFVDKATIDGAIETMRSWGMRVVNVHTHRLGEGHLPTLEDIHRVRAVNDPKGLLNSGRVPPIDATTHTTVLS